MIEKVKPAVTSEDVLKLPETKGGPLEEKRRVSLMEREAGSEPRIPSVHDDIISSQ